jgi:hypothetical protein
MVTPLIPLNAFRSITKKLTTSSTLIYTAPQTVSSIILSATCANFSSNTVSVTVIIEKPTLPLPSQYFVVPDIEIPAKDVLSAIAGRVVLEQGDRLYAYASANESVDFVMSLNEAANE